MLSYLNSVKRLTTEDMVSPSTSLLSEIGIPCMAHFDQAGSKFTVLRPQPPSGTETTLGTCALPTQWPSSR